MTSAGVGRGGGQGFYIPPKPSNHDDKGDSSLEALVPQINELEQVPRKSSAGSEEITPWGIKGRSNSFSGDSQSKEKEENGSISEKNSLKTERSLKLNSSLPAIPVINLNQVKKKPPPHPPLRGGWGSAIAGLTLTHRDKKEAISYSFPSVNKVFLENYLGLKVVSYETWKEKLYNKIARSTKTVLLNLKTIPPKEKSKEIVRRVFGIALKWSSICARVEKAVEIFGNNSYLSDFVGCQRPKKFREKYKKLRPEEQEGLKIIIGGADSYKIYEAAISSKTQKEGYRLSRKVARVESAPGLKSSPTYLQSGFDNMTPLLLISCQSITETFRAFWSSDLSEIQAHFKIKGHKLNPLEGKGFPEPVDRSIVVLCYLLQNFGQALGYAPRQDIYQKTELLNIKDYRMLLEKLDQELHKRSCIADKEFCRLLKSHCKKVLKSDPTLGTLELAFLTAHSNGNTKLEEREELFVNTLRSASDWLLACLRSQECFQKKRWGEAAEFLVDEVYPKLLVYPLLKKEIPFLHLLQAISNSAYAPCDYFMREALFKGLFTEEIGDISLKWSPRNTTCFTITLEQKGDKVEFIATQKKKYDLAVLTEGRNRNSIGSTTIEWSIYGDLDSHKASAKHEVKEFSFLKGVSQENKEKVLAHYHWDWMKGENPWKQFLPSN